MKKPKIIAVVIYSIVVVATMGFLCYQCYTLTNSNIELTEANKNLQAELATLSESSHDKKTVELLEMMIAAADSMDFYRACNDRTGEIRSLCANSNGDLSYEFSELEEMKQTIRDERTYGTVYSINEWIEKNHPVYSSEISYQLSMLKEKFTELFSSLESYIYSTHFYYTTGDSDYKSFYIEALVRNTSLLLKTCPDTEEIISNIITYCIEALYSETNGK